MRPRASPSAAGSYAQSNLIMVSTVQLQMFAIWLAAAFCTGLANECAGDSSCSRGVEGDDVEATDMWLLQVQQNISQVEESVSNRSGAVMHAMQNESHVSLAQSNWALLQQPRLVFGAEAFPSSAPATTLPRQRVSFS